MPPATHYLTRSAGSIAYQVLGEGRRTVLYVQEVPSHLDLIWIDDGYARALEGLATDARVVLFDRPGMGLSDPVDHAPTLEEQAEDIAAVLDETGTERAVIFSIGASTPGVLLFAASHPERVDALVLWEPYARGFLRATAESPNPIVAGEEMLVERILARWESVGRRWGEGLSLQMMAPALASGTIRRSWGLLERASASPAMFRAIYHAAIDCDVTDVLGLVRAPTTVLHSPDSYALESITRHVADGVADGTYHLLPTSDGASGIGDVVEPVFRHVRAAATGAPAAAPVTRTLATVLFTDIVQSTERAVALGDAAWRELLTEHHELLRRRIAEHGGRLVDTTGDGSLSVFGGPAAAIECARAIGERSATSGVEVRAGVHTGECERMGDDLGGVGVHIGARISAAAAAGEILVSRTVVDLVAGSGLEFADRGEHELKGIPGRWQLFAVAARGKTTLPVEAHAPQPTVADRAVLTAARRSPATLRVVSRLQRRARRR